MGKNVATFKIFRIYLNFVLTLKINARTVTVYKLKSNRFPTAQKREAIPKNSKKVFKDCRNAV